MDSEAYERLLAELRERDYGELVEELEAGRNKKEDKEDVDFEDEDMDVSESNKDELTVEQILDMCNGDDDEVRFRNQRFIGDSIVCMVNWWT